MNLLNRKSRWKFYLALAGLVIVIVSLLYTSQLAERLAVVEENNIRFWGMAMLDVTDTDAELQEYCDQTLQLEIMRSNHSIPVILANENDQVTAGNNWGISKDTNMIYLQAQLDKLIESNAERIPTFGGYVYFGESQILQQLRYFPVFQLLLVGGFIIFGYIGVNSARRAEQNQVWVGMAKETAHQLGTPISAILAWIEHLKIIREGDEETGEVLEELLNDVNRLELVADRFSKIGSAPKLSPVNVYEELEICREYMQRRAPRKVSFTFPEPDLPVLPININRHLFDWVIENLLRNALDAMEQGRGAISAEVYDDSDNVYIDISDTGKGIPSNKFKRVFQPGFTTKKRGWGLGLSLAKRIIEEYHQGKIFVKKSEEGAGTTFTISMPKIPKT